MSHEAKRVPAANFKANCLRLMDEVARERIPIITKRGTPVAKLVPIEETAIDLFGYMAGTAKIRGDLVEPSEAKWEADDTNI